MSITNDGYLVPTFTTNNWRKLILWITSSENALLPPQHTFFDPPPPGGKSIPTELRSEATELQKKMKYDDAEREGLVHIWKCFTLSVWAQKIWLLTTTSHVDERHCVVSRKVTSCILFSLSLSPPFLAFSSSFSSVLRFIFLFFPLLALSTDLAATTHKDDEYVWAGVEDPKIVVTTYHNPSSRLKQFAKVLIHCKTKFAI